MKKKVQSYTFPVFGSILSLFILAALNKIGNVKAGIIYYALPLTAIWKPL